MLLFESDHIVCLESVLPEIRAFTAAIGAGWSYIVNSWACYPETRNLVIVHTPSAVVSGFLSLCFVRQVGVPAVNI